MTREEAKRRAELYSALAEGKTIQIFNMEGNWVDIEVKKLNYIPETLKFRIKPQSNYRPFKSQEECWNGMLEHNPFGWVKSKDKGYFHLIGLVQWSSELEDVMIIFATSEQLARSSRSLFEDYIFADGTPFSIKEEQQ